MKSFFLTHCGGFLLQMMLVCAAIVPVVAVVAVGGAARAEGPQNPFVVAGLARFTVISPECIRMEYQKKGVFVDEPSMFAVNRKALNEDFKISREGISTVIDTGAIRLVYTPDGDAFNADNLKATIKKGDSTVEWRAGMPSAGNLGGTIRTVDGVKEPVDLGEGVLSRDGWYVLDDSRKNIFTADWVASRPKDAGTDWYLFGYGDDYKGAIESLTSIGGKAPLPRKYTMGAWYSRYWPYSSKDYRQIVNEYEQHDFPLDIIVMDMDWHKDGWTGWSWNRKLLPDAEDLLKWYHENGIFVTLNLHPADGIGPHEDMYSDFMKAMGQDPAKKETIPFDAGDKKYLDTLFKYAIEPHEKEGVDFWWLDWQQYPYTKSIPDLTNLAWLNHYFYQHTGQGGMRGQSFSRWAGWGDHRYPIHFSGDAHTGWPMLAFEVALTSTAGNVACFFWSHDIGGHMGGRNEESYTRWVQFGATSAALRSHSTRSPDMDRRPWTYHKWAENSMRIAFHLRSELFPYIYSSAWQVYDSSTPLNRSMYYVYPDVEKAYHNAQQYFYGDALLAAPVSRPGVGPGRVGTQVVWFPGGTWYNWFTGEKFSGESEVVVAADINEFPLYARGGTPIPMQHYAKRMATEPLKELVVRVYPGEDKKTGKYSLYEDDGITTEYQTGAHALTDISYERNGNDIAINIGAATGTYKGQLKERSYVVELPCTKEATSVMVDGKGAKSEYDANENINRIKVPVTSISSAVKITLKAEDADFKAISGAAEKRRVKGLVKEPSGGSLQDEIASLAGSNGDPEILESLMAAGGLALVRKNEGVYLYKGKETYYLYARPGLADRDAFTFNIVEQIGDNEKVILSEKKTAQGDTRFDIPTLPELSAPPVFGVATKRYVKVDFEVKGKPVSLVREIETKPSYLTKWNIAGLFALDRDKSLKDQVFGPEQGKFDLAATYKGGVGGTNVKWRRARANDQNIIDLNDNFHIPQNDKIAYAVTFIDSDAEQAAVFTYNSDDGIEIWLNGEKLASKDTSSGYSLIDASKISGTLKAGRNTLMVKVSQFWDNWGFKISVEAKKPVKDTFGAK